ncbi:MAG: hypothetical protein RIC95_12060 [Vicingaceae bacterium]
MRVKSLNLLLSFSLFNLMACSQNADNEPQNASPITSKEISKSKSISHNFGGWYCPDNLNGFPPVEPTKWKKVPVISGRMPTLEETKTEASLIYVDPEKYPNAESLEMKLPALALYNDWNSQRREPVIVIQAFRVGRDSIVGFRYLNGGNGSANLMELSFDFKIEEHIPENSQFITKSVFINAKAVKVWEVLTKSDYKLELAKTLGLEKVTTANWREKTNVNFYYEAAGIPTTKFADVLFGNFYIHNNYDSLNYTEKFMLLENEQTGLTELKIVCGPYLNNFQSQQKTLNQWGKKVKILSEG